MLHRTLPSRIKSRAYAARLGIARLHPDALRGKKKIAEKAAAHITSKNKSIEG